MRLFQALRGGREDMQGPEMEAPAEPQAPEDAPYLAATQEIGARQELVSADLAAVAQLVTQLQHLGPMVQRVREPLKVEFDAFRRDHVALVEAKGQVETLLASVRTLRESEQALGARLKEAVKASGKDHAEIEELRKALSHAIADGSRTREALAGAMASGEDLKASLHEAESGVRRLQEDTGALRLRVDQGAERRRELDALAARSRQDAELAEAENASLRHRIDEVADQFARVTRQEAQAQADLSAERERATAQLAEAERGQRDAVAHAQAFEAQLAAARASGASLATRMEASLARGVKLEQLCMELSTKANDAISYRHALEGAAGDEKKGLDRALERIEQLERVVAEQKSSHTALDRARLTALERGDQLASALQAQEGALMRAEERSELLEASLKELALDEETMRSAHEDQTRQVSGELRRLETEIELSKAALNAARSHRTFSTAT